MTVAAQSRVVSTSAAIFSSQIDECQNCKNKEKPKTGPRPGPRLNYDVKIGPKPSPRGVKKVRARRARAEMQGSSGECGKSFISFPVAQMVEHGASNAKIMGSIPRESKS